MYSEEGRSFDIITAKEEALASPKVEISASSGSRLTNKQERFDSDEHYVKMQVRRNRLKAKEEDVKDAASLISQYINKAIKVGLDIRNVFMEALQMTAAQSFIVPRAINKYMSNKFKMIEKQA